MSAIDAGAVVTMRLMAHTRTGETVHAFPVTVLEAANPAGMLRVRAEGDAAERFGAHHWVAAADVVLADAPMLAVIRYGNPNTPVWVGHLTGRDDSRPLMLADDATALAALETGSAMILGRWHYVLGVPAGTTMEALAEAIRPAQWEATR